MGNSLSKINFMENAIIYKILCKDELIKDCYIGSTFNFDVRYNEHKSVCNNENSHCYNLKVYQFIRNNGGFDNFKFEILLSFDCDRRTREIEIKEQEYLDEFKPSLNSCKAYQTEEGKKEYKKEHYENNKEKIKLYYQSNKEYIKEYQENNKEKIKDYQKEYKEYNKENNKKHYEKHKAKFLEKVNCNCGGKFTYTNKSTHEKTQRHQKFINLI